MGDMLVRFLIVDDEKINCRIVSKYLEGHGHDIDIAYGGPEAWEILQDQSKNIDVVLTDRMMPYMDGITLCKNIKADPRLKHIPVIILTAAAEAWSLEEGKKEGVLAHITKPFEKENLLDVLREVLGEGKV